MMNELYIFTIFAIELIYKYIYLALISITDSYGWALLALSLLNYVLLLPLNKLVRGLQEAESNIREILEPQLLHIKETSSASARHLRIQNLFQRYSYHPIFAIRNVFPLLVQIPFLMAVYFMLSSLPHIEGVRFLFLGNLARPDAMLYGFNVMPIIMTLINLVSACFVMPLSKQQKRQAIIVALIFCVLLYNAPSALVLYWTMNNVIVLTFTLLAKINTVTQVKSSLQALKQRLLPSAIHSTGLLLGLSIILPMLFTISNNVNLFSETQIVNFTIFCTAVACGTFLAATILDRLIKLSSNYSICFQSPCRFSIKKNEAAAPLRKINLDNFLYIIISLVATYLLTVLCLNIKVYIANSLVVNLIRLSFIAFLFLLLKKQHIRLFNICLLSLIAFSSIQFAHNFNKNTQAAHSLNLLIEDAFSNFPLHEPLSYKPNIYLVILESYMGPRVLKETYQYDNSAFENSLTKQGFKIYDDIYSHAAYTKGTLLNLFLMRDDVSAVSFGEQDVVSKAHDIYSGSRENLLFRYLKMNDYSISCYYDHQAYLIKSREEYLDYTLDEIDNSLQSVIKIIQPSLNHKIESLKRKFKLGDQLAPDRQQYQSIIKHINDIQDFAHPAFFLIKPSNSLHHDLENDVPAKDYQSWISSNVYQRGVDDANTKILSIVDKIQKNDPDSVIILLGDHGHKYARAAAKSKEFVYAAPADIKIKYPYLNMSTQELIDDMFSVFLAIKMPKNKSIELDSNYAFSDLFRYIFATLDDNPTFLDHRSSNVSINFKGTVLKRDDKLFENGENSNR